MDPHLVEFVGPIAGILILMTGSLVGMRMWLNRPVRTSALPEGEVQRLAESVEVLAEQVHQLRGDMVDLHERVDFAERLLAKGE